MGKTISTYIAFDKDLVKDGKAVLNDDQLSSIEATSATRMSKKLTYVIPKQWVHESKLRRPINGCESSLRIYAFGFDNRGGLVEIQEPSVSSLRWPHYGTTDDSEPIAKIKINKMGFRRIEDGIRTFSVCKDVDIPFCLSGRSLYVSRNISLRLINRILCYAPGFVQTIGGWDVKYKDINGVEYVDFVKRFFNIYEEVEADYVLDWGSISDVNDLSFKYLPL